MNLHDDHLPPLWMERGDHYHWEDLTETELALEELERPPHSVALEEASRGHRATTRALRDRTLGNPSTVDNGPPESDVLPSAPLRASFGDPRLPDRFWSKATLDEAGCWVWHRTAGGGYGQFWKDGAYRAAHRVAYEALVGPIPAGLQADHLCKVRLCVNPAHIEPVTPAENNRRSPCCSTGYAERTHCKHGHEYTPENTQMHGAVRLCIECKRRYARDYYHRKKFAQGLGERPSRHPSSLGGRSPNSSREEERP